MRHTSLLQMKKFLLSILCTAYCNTIMPQSEYIVDNICTTVIIKVLLLNMYEKYLKKKVYNSTCQPCLSHNQYFPSAPLITAGWALVAHRRFNCSFQSKKNKTKTGLKHFLSITFMHSLLPLCMFLCR